MEQDCWDLMCLKALKVNGESQRVALAAASIVVHAHAIARDAPGQAGEARRIVELARSLYAAMPSRRALTGMIDDGWFEAVGPTDSRTAAMARERLVERIWRHFHHGSGDGQA